MKVKSLSRVQLFSSPRTDYSLPGSSIHEIFQARILEWVAVSGQEKKILLQECSLLSLRDHMGMI